MAPVLQPSHLNTAENYEQKIGSWWHKILRNKHKLILPLVNLKSRLQAGRHGPRLLFHVGRERMDTKFRFGDTELPKVYTKFVHDVTSINDPELGTGDNVSVSHEQTPSFNLSQLF